MKPQSKPLFSRARTQELIRLCNEKMVCAARDLAEFTKNGINAGFIVALAHKCEHLASSMNGQPDSLDPNTRQAVEHEIMHSLQDLCALGKQIFSHHPSKVKDYEIPYLVPESAPADQDNREVA